MKYNLSIKTDRKKFIKRANRLLKHQRVLVSLVDESDRTVKQNNYIHVLCRILALETGTSEQYSKQVYFKEMANKDIFVRATKDPLSNNVIKTIRSTCELTIPEMSKAISSFILWAAEQGYKLPEAHLNDKGELEFASEEDKEAFRQAEIMTSKLDEFIM